MKIREGFVSNSSSSSFIITNKTDKLLTVKDFLDDIGEIVQERWNIQFATSEYDMVTQEQLIDSLYYDEDYNYYNKTILPGENLLTFGDEYGRLYHRVLDYVLRESLDTDRFKCRLDEINH